MSCIPYCLTRFCLSFVSCELSVRLKGRGYSDLNFPTRPQLVRSSEWKVLLPFIIQRCHHLTGYCKMVVILNSGFSFTFIRWNFSAKKRFLSSTRTTRSTFLSHCFFPGQRVPALGTPRGTSGSLGWGWGWVRFLWVTLWAWGTASGVFQSIAVVHFDA